MSSAWVSIIIDDGLFGVVITLLFIDETRLFDEGSHVELLEAALVDWPAFKRMPDEVVAPCLVSWL